MQFQVPQYIDVKDKIVGPLTLQQFFYLATGFLIIFITYFFFATALWIITSGIIGSAAVALALVQYNGRPLMTILGAAIRYFWNPRHYQWQREQGQLPAFQGFLARLGLQLKTSTTPIRRGDGAFSFFKRILTPEE